MTYYIIVVHYWSLNAMENSNQNKHITYTVLSPNTRVY